MEIGSTDHDDEELAVAIDALTSGKNPYGFVPIGKSRLKAKIAQIQIEGRTPQNKDEWGIVQKFRSWVA